LIVLLRKCPLVGPAIFYQAEMPQYVFPYHSETSPIEGLRICRYKEKFVASLRGLGSRV
jgi:hypothetical protein